MLGAGVGWPADGEALVAGAAGGTGGGVKSMLYAVRTRIDSAKATSRRRSSIRAS
jgi:hypothetical protein